MTLIAYVDDSAETGDALVLAGYISTAENWVEFSQEWKELLSLRPPWLCFKMNEIAWRNSSEA